MNRISLFVLLLFLSTGLFGQDNDTIANKVEEKTTTVQDELWERFNTQAVQLDQKQKTITRLKEDSAAMQADISLQKGKIVELEKEVAEANKAAEKSKRDYETIKQAVLSKDAVLYKQCLLYPLEQRYKPDLIDDALGTVSAFAELGQMSERFQEYKNTYEPLLKQYGQYNQQLLDYLLSRIEYIEVREKKLGEGRQIPIPDNWMKELKDLPYYQECYIGKDTPPYKSIIYLDDVIDEIKNAIEQNSGLKTELQKLAKKLEPKKN